MKVETRKQWYAIYTRAKWEKKATELLLKKGIEVYCPLTKIQHHWAERKKAVSEPLFTSYVFVCISDSQMLTVKQTDGILNFVYWLSKPVVIPNDEIDTIKKFLTEYDYASVEKSDVKPGERVRIINGPLMMWEGNVIEIKTNTIKILLPTLGHSLIVEFKKHHNETVSAQGLKLKAI